MNYNNIIDKFNINGKILSAGEYGEGHINDTIMIQAENDNYILQKININIFKNPDHVMDNIMNVTSYLKDRIREEGGDAERETMTVIPTADGSKYCKCDDGYYRMYTCIKDTKTYQKIEDPHHFYSAGKTFGKFQRMLGDFPAHKLHDIIPDFHNTPKRITALRVAVAEDKAGRMTECEKEIEFVLSRENVASEIVKAIDDGRVPVRVTHNDTKLNNILFDETGSDGVCVIDLDTVMPGSMLFDFGDAIRFGASTAAEDEKDLDKVNFDIALFEEFTKGFTEPLKDVMTDAEKELLPLSAVIMSLECGMRFLTDYLQGDTYFKTHYPSHNLDRCRTQLKLVSEMENRLDEMRDIVNKYVK